MKKLFISILLTLMISGISYFIYVFTNIEKNHYIFKQTYISGSNISGANLFFFNNMYDMNIFFNFEKINKTIVDSYMSQEICRGILSDRIFKIPLTIIPFNTPGFIRITYELTAETMEIGTKCMNDIKKIIEKEEKRARSLVEEVMELEKINLTNSVLINEEEQVRLRNFENLISASKNINFYEISENSSYKTEARRSSLVLNIFIISFSLVFSFLYRKEIFIFTKNILSEIKK